MTFVAAAIGAIGPGPGPARAASEKARLGDLTDVSFGLIVSFADRSISENLCAYASSNTNLYSVTAVGSGSGGAFTLSSGAAQLPYDVLWADAPSQTGGTALVSASPAGGFTSTARQQTCNSGPSSTASLTLVIRSATLNAASAGSYSGALQITIAPE